VSKQFQYMDNAIIQVFADPAPSSPLSFLKLAYKDREYKIALGESQTTITAKSNALFGGQKEQSVTHVNPENADKAGRLYRELHRLKAEHACRVHTNLLSLAKTSDGAIQNVRVLTDLLMGALVPPDSGRDFKVDVSKRQDDINSIVQGWPAGQATLLTPEEATCLFVIPRYDLGVNVSKRATFASGSIPIPAEVEQSNSAFFQQEPSVVTQSPTPPVSNGSDRPSVWLVGSREFVVVGNPLRENGSPIITSLVWFRPHDLESHMLICGNTRSGKTTTAVSIVAQEIKCGIIPTVLVPSKPWDWRVLRYVEPKLHIFTAGNPGVAPLRINIWSPPPGVPLSKWV